MEKQVKSRRWAVAATAAGVAMLCAVSAARADITAFSPSAYAESELRVSGFQFNLAGTTTPLGTLVGTSITNLDASLSSTLSASINGVPGIVAGPPSGTTINPIAAGNPQIHHSVAAGPDSANYVPYSSYAIGSLGGGVFAGSASDHVGNGLQLNGAGPTVADTQAQVNINGASGSGSADSRQTLSTFYTLSIGPGGLGVDVLFNADAFMRVALGQPDVQAKASRRWTLTVEQLDASGNPLSTVVDWQPDGVVGTGLGGSCVGSAACGELADGFDMTSEISRLNTADVGGSFTGAFGLRAFLPAGDYQVTISHITNADAAALVPEPGTLSMIGLSMLGLAAARRRRKS